MGFLKLKAASKIESKTEKKGKMLSEYQKDVIKLKHSFFKMGYQTFFQFLETYPEDIHPKAINHYLKREPFIDVRFAASYNKIRDKPFYEKLHSLMYSPKASKSLRKADSSKALDCPEAPVKNISDRSQSYKNVDQCSVMENWVDGNFLVRVRVQDDSFKKAYTAITNLQKETKNELTRLQKLQVTEDYETCVSERISDFRLSSRFAVTSSSRSNQKLPTQNKPPLLSPSNVKSLERQDSHLVSNIMPKSPKTPQSPKGLKSPRGRKSVFIDDIAKNMSKNIQTNRQQFNPFGDFPPSTSSNAGSASKHYNSSLES